MPFKCKLCLNFPSSFSSPIWGIFFCLAFFFFFNFPSWSMISIALVQRISLEVDSRKLTVEKTDNEIKTHVAYETCCPWKLTVMQNRALQPSDLVSVRQLKWWWQRAVTGRLQQSPGRGNSKGQQPKMNRQEDPRGRHERQCFSWINLWKGGRRKQRSLTHGKLENPS